MMVVHVFLVVASDSGPCGTFSSLEEAEAFLAAVEPSGPGDAVVVEYEVCEPLARQIPPAFRRAFDS